MGVPKATLRVDGEALAVRAARALAAVCDPVLEVGPGHTGRRCVVEDPPGGGPVAALLAGWDALDAPTAVVVLACDLPFVDAALVRLLVEWPGDGCVVPLLDGRPQPTCARFGSDAVDAARAVVADGPASFRAVLARASVDYVSESRWRAVAPATALVDVDTPADATRWGVEPPR
jgi:molybdopterin-guanine dinucleotide biosynthesis protein A